MARRHPRHPHPPEVRAAAMQRLELGATVAELFREGIAGRTTLEGWARETKAGSARAARWKAEAQANRARVIEAARTGPISAELLDDALTVLGLDADRAATTLGAGSAGIVLAWRTGALPIPTYVAAHVRSLIASHDRHG